MIQGITSFNTLTSISLFLSLTLGLFFLVHRSSREQGNFYVGLILLYLSSFFLQGFLWGARIIAYFPHCIQFGLYTSMALGPLMFFYIRAKIKSDFRFRPKDYLHFLPLLLDLLWSLPYLLTDGTVKIAELEQFLLDGIYPLPHPHLIIKALQLGLYFVLTIRMIYLYRRHFRNSEASGRTLYYRWLCLFSGLLLLPILMMMISAFTAYNLLSLLVLILMVFSFIVAIYFAVLLRPEVFHTFPGQFQPRPEREKYEHSRLGDEQKARLLTRLQHYMKNERPHREPELTIGELSNRLGVPTSYLSQVINERLEMNFMDFINSYRVADAKTLLRDAAYQHYSIVSLGYEAGFNSKSTFYSAFKRFTETSPGKYRVAAN